MKLILRTKQIVMKYIFILLCIGLGICGFAQDSKINSAQGPFSQIYVVIADTAQDYDVLHDKMNVLKKKLHSKIDLIGRIYDRSKKQICLPETSDYYLVEAGGYFLRDHVSKFLSLEYLDYYNPSSFTTTSTTIALVTHITEDKKKAKKYLKKVKKHAPKAFILKTIVFRGCWN